MVKLSNYLGGANELTNVLNSYVNSQEGFIDKAASVAQIILGISKQFNPSDAHATLFHEVGHMNDYNSEYGQYESTMRFEMLLKTGANITYKDADSYNKNQAPTIDTITLPNGQTINHEDIGHIIRGYASTNLLEFTAKVSTLVSSGAISYDGKNWTINPQNVPKGYCTGWSADNQYAQEKLNAIMSLFNYLTNYKYMQ